MADRIIDQKFYISIPFITDQPACDFRKLQKRVNVFRIFQIVFFQQFFQCSHRFKPFSQQCFLSGTLFDTDEKQKVAFHYGSKVGFLSMQNQMSRSAGKRPCFFGSRAFFPFGEYQDTTDAAKLPDLFPHE